MRTSTRCPQDKWRTLLAGGIKVFLTLFLLSFLTTDSYGQGAYKPCAAHRWNSGEAWYKDPTSGLWTGIPATGQTQPQGVVGCASAAATESGLEAYAGIYNPADFAITGLTDCFSQVTETFGNSLTGPTAGEQIVWFNFDIRPLAGTYQFQVVTNEPVGWALYYVDPADARPNASDAGPTYPTSGLSGNCLNLKPANIISGGVSHGNCGIAGNGWSTITVPSFKKPTNYYLAMWMAPENVTTFTNNMNLIYKSRYGCGGATCTLEFIDQTFECSANGYTVCGTFAGSAGRWILQDNAAVKATSYTVTTYKQDGTTVVTGPTTYTSLNGTQTVTLGIIPDGAVYAKICATYPTSQPYNISLLPDGTYVGGSGYVTCSDGASFSGAAPVPPVVDASPNTQNLDLSKAHVANFTATTTGGTGTITYAWTQLTPDANTSFTFNSSTGAATFTVNALTQPLPLSYDFKVVATDAIGCTSEETVHVIPSATLEPCGIYGPATTCANTTGLVYTYGAAGPPPAPYTLNTTDYTYTWSISGNGTITSGTTDAGTVTVSSTTAGTFIVTMTVHNKPPGILPDRTCTYTVTVNAIPDAPGAGNNARCGPGTVTLSATGCSGGTLNWYDAATGGNLVGTGASFTTPSLTATTTYYVSCTVGDCVSPRTAVTATVNPIPDAPAGGANFRCGPGTVSLTATGCTGGTLNWYAAASGGASLGTGSPFTTPSISTTTTYYVSCTIGDCVSPRTAVTATVNPIPDAPAGGANFRCGPGTVSLTATGCTGGTLNWYAAASGGASLGTGSPFTTPSISTTTTYYVSCTVGDCVSPRTAVVATVYDIPATPQLTVVQPTCLIAASITVTSPLGAQYTYRLNSGTPQASPVFGNLAPGAYTVVAIGPGGCESTAANATINAVPEVPAAPGAGNNARCGTGTVTLSATGCTGGTLNWYAAASGGESLGTGSTFTTPSISTTTTYYVSCTVGDCVSPRTAVTATVNPIPDAPTGGANFRCGPGTVSLTATGCTGGTLNWYAAASGGASLGTGSPFTTPSISTTTTYYVSCTVGDCVSPRTAVVATVYDIPATPQLTVVQPTCLIAASITVTSPLGAQYTYRLNSGTPQASPVFGNLAPGAYTVVAIGPGGCESTAANATINAVPEVPAAPGAGNNARCGTGTVTLSATGCTGGTLNWYAAASGGLSLGTGSTFTTPSISTTTTYYVSCTVGDCVSPRTAVTATVNPIPDAPGAGNNARCNPGTVTLSATGCTGGTLNWYAAASGGASLGTGSTFTTPSISTTTTYYVSCTIGDCVSPRTAVVATVNSLGAVAATPTSTTCGQNNGGFTITSPVGAGITYVINNGAPTSQTTFSGLAAGNYSILAMGTGGCTSSGSVTVGSSSTLDAVHATPTATTCGLNNGGFTITSPVGAGITYVINNGAPTSQTTFSGLAAGNYSILAMGTGGCTSSGSVTVGSSSTLDAVHATPTATTCGLNNGGFTITSPVGAGITYVINNGAPTSQTTFSGLAAGNYSILAMSTGGCTSSGSVTVGSSSTLGAVHATPTATTCGLNNGGFTITSPVGAGITYVINNGAPTSQTTFSGLAAGNYSILAMSTAGCTSSGSVTVGGSQPCLTYCSYTQGFWGNKNGLKLLPGLLTTPIVIGRPGHSFTIPAGSATMVNNAMPGGTTPRMLLPGDCVMSTAANGCFKTSYSTKQGKFNNVLLSQTITLTLNTRLAGNPLLTLPIQSGCLVTGMGSFEMNQSVVNYLTYNGASATVADLLNLANDLLGGTLTPGANVGTPSKPRIVPSYSDVTSAIDAINNAFDGCTSFNGYQTCVTTSLVVMARVAPGASTISDHVKVSAYPNPYTDKVRFTIKSTVSGQGSLDVFNMVGQKVKTVYQGYVHANTEQVVEYRVPDVSRQNLIFVMTVNGEKVTGKLLNAKE